MENEKLTKIGQDIKAKQVSAIKDVIRLTFEQIQSLEKIRNGLQEQIKVLKLDLIDLKDGRLDRVHERQVMSETCKTTSILEILKKDNNEKNPWYVDYEIKYILDSIETTIRINNSITKTHAAGSYKLKDGSIRYL